MSTLIPYTADELVGGITVALRERDMDAVVGLMKMLARVDPKRAQEVLDTVEAGLELAQAGESR